MSFAYVIRFNVCLYQEDATKIYNEKNLEVELGFLSLQILDSRKNNFRMLEKLLYIHIKQNFFYKNTVSERLMSQNYWILTYKTNSSFLAKLCMNITYDNFKAEVESRHKYDVYIQV